MNRGGVDWVDFGDASPPRVASLCRVDPDDHGCCKGHN